LNTPSSSRLLLEHHGSHRIVELLAHNSNTPTAKGSSPNERRAPRHLSNFTSSHLEHEMLVSLHQKMMTEQNSMIGLHPKTNETNIFN